MIRWWERRRLIYNVIIVGLCIFYLISYWNYPMVAIIGKGPLILNSIVLIAVLNLFYIAGWGMEIIAHFLFKSPGLPQGLRWLFFVSGVFIAIVLTSTYFTLELDVLFSDPPPLR